MKRPLKEKVYQAIENCPLCGPLELCYKYGVNYKTDVDCGNRRGTFKTRPGERINFKTAKEAINPYLANILRERSRICIIKRDIELHFLDHQETKKYLVVVNPFPEECDSDDEHEVVAIAKSDGNGSFTYFFYEEDFWNDIQQPYMTRKRRQDEPLAIIKKLHRYQYVVKIFVENPQGDFLGITKSGRREKLNDYYASFLVYDKEKTEHEVQPSERGSYSIEYYQVKTKEVLTLDKELAFTENKITIVNKTLELLRLQKERILQKIQDNQ